MDTAAEAGLSMNRYWRIESGYAEPTPAERAAIARVLEVRVSDAFPVPDETVAS